MNGHMNRAFLGESKKRLLRFLVRIGYDPSPFMDSDHGFCLACCGLGFSHSNHSQCTTDGRGA